MELKKLFTSESVTDGHPDKVCDIISDSVLDAILSQDKMARVACECAASTGMVHVMGEITTDCYVNIDSIAQQAALDIGYDNSEYGFDGHSLCVLTTIKTQSPDIAMGVNKSHEAKQGTMTDGLDIGAGDQGMMFGYACDETPELMPMPISIAHQLARRLSYVRKNNIIPHLRPDGKTQVTIEYDGDKPLRIDTVVVSSQHDEEISQEELTDNIIREVITPVVPQNFFDSATKVYVNPTGRFVVGGPKGDCGLTGRKIIVDTYGGYARHGGGAFSGKDPTKVDRSAAYAARYAAKNVVAAKLANRCEIQLAYAIGVARPVSINVNTFGTGKISDKEIAQRILKFFDFRPAAIIEQFDLRRPIYKATAAFGHFGRTDVAFPWESTEKAELLLK